MYTQVFTQEEEFLRFLNNCLLQFIKLKFGTKKKFIDFIEKQFEIKIPQSFSCLKTLMFLSKKLKEDEQSILENIFGVSSLIEICHLYLFYKLLTELFYETTWTKVFSPFYEFIFGKKVKIRNKKELRQYAAEIVTRLNQRAICEKWIEFSSTRIPYPLVIHFDHFIIGPLGFFLTPYYREKRILEFPKPILDLLVTYIPTEQEIVNWKETDIAQLLSSLVREIENGIDKTFSKFPVYKKYLKQIGFEFPSSEWKTNILKLVKDFHNNLKRNLIPLWFFQLEQLTGMFLDDRDVIRMLNFLISRNSLVISGDLDLDYVKISKDSILIKPESWIARPAIDLAKDIQQISGERDFWCILRDILGNGAISYLEQVYEQKPDLFKKLLIKKCLYKFADSDLALVPKDTAIRRLLESYGFHVPSISGFDFRNELREFIGKLRRFKKDYCSLDEKTLVRRIISFLWDGRNYTERILKEFSFILTSLMIYYEQASVHQTSEVFLVDRPLFLPSSFVREQDITRIRNEFFRFWTKVISNEKIKNLKRDKFTLGEWFSLCWGLLNYVKASMNSFLKSLPNDMEEKISKFRKLSKKITKEILVWLNTASHERGRRKIRNDIHAREKALEALLNLDIILYNLFSCLPLLVEIVNEVNEIKTGLKFYEVITTGIDSSKKKFKIYGTRFLDSSYNYYLIFQRKEEREIGIVAYPVLITNLVDIIIKET